MPFAAMCLQAAIIARSATCSAGALFCGRWSLARSPLMRSEDQLSASCGPCTTVSPVVRVSVWGRVQPSSCLCPARRKWDMGPGGSVGPHRLPCAASSDGGGWLVRHANGALTTPGDRPNVPACLSHYKHRQPGERGARCNTHSVTELVSHDASYYFYFWLAVWGIIFFSVSLAPRHSAAFNQEFAQAHREPDDSLLVQRSLSEALNGGDSKDHDSSDEG